MLVATPRTTRTTPTRMRMSQVGMVDPFDLWSPIRRPGVPGAVCHRTNLAGEAAVGTSREKLRRRTEMLCGRASRAVTCGFTWYLACPRAEMRLAAVRVKDVIARCSSSAEAVQPHRLPTNHP